jgi:glucosamine--fructose-6-phosphate aminotransferase (isomerizing)
MGKLTISEILGQPQCWLDCFEALRRQDRFAGIRRQISGEQEWLFTGCGSSYNIAQIAAATWTQLSGRPARALPASEILLCPQGALPRSGAFQSVLISRSGWTSEVLRAGEFLQKQHGVPALAAVCEEGSPLEKMAAATLLLAAANDQSTAVTRAFSATVLALQALAADYSGQSPVAEMIPRLAGQMGQHLRTLPARIEEFVGARDFSHHIFLGQGPYHGVAQESVLKLMEMSCSSAQAFHTLEFRHGPKAVTNPRLLVTFFLSKFGYDAECAVLEEIKGLGATTMVIANRADEATRRSADLLIELDLEAPEFLRPAAAVIPGQLLGYYLSRKNGINADRPPHLNRVVSLEPETESIP